MKHEHSMSTDQRQIYISVRHIKTHILFITLFDFCQVSDIFCQTLSRAFKYLTFSGRGVMYISISMYRTAASKAYPKSFEKNESVKNIYYIYIIISSSLFPVPRRGGEGGTNPETFLSKTPRPAPRSSLTAPRPGQAALWNCIHVSLYNLA